MKMPTLRSFLSGIIDYAGLFPPAQLDMRTAVRNYSEYRAGKDRDLLGRFVLPASRLDEFAEVSRAVLERGAGSVPWCLSVIVDGDIAEARRTMMGFTANHMSSSRDGHAMCDAVEIRPAAEQDIVNGSAAFASPIHRFFEVSPGDRLRYMLETIALRGDSAKIRTGGVKQDAFPRSDSVVRFINECNRLGISFKATAGLHHAVCGSYPLTYEAGAEHGNMYGFINVFLASAFIRRGVGDEEARDILEESSSDAFAVHLSGVTWRSHELSRDDLRLARARLFLSFGSCSFEEPVDEAKELGLV